jgi:hypothetical protein
MPNEPPSPPPSSTWGQYAYLSSLYFVSVGVLYLWGYWASFDINILEYAGLTDILKTAAYPIASAFALFALGAVTGEFLGRNTRPTVQLPPNRAMVAIKRWAPFLALLYLTAVVALFLFGPETKWQALPMLIAIPAFIVGRRLGLFDKNIPNESLRSIAVFLFVALPMFALGQGKTKAIAILNGTSYTYAPDSVAGLPLEESQIPARRSRYLGQAGGVLFFYNPKHNSTVVVRFEHANAVELKAYPDKSLTLSPAASAATPGSAAVPSVASAPLRPSQVSSSASSK